MKTFRTLEQSKKDIQVIEDYVDLLEKYELKTCVPSVIHTYVMHGSIVKTAEILNSQGHTFEKEGISAIIKSTSLKGDLLHKKVKSLSLKKMRSSRRGN